MPHKRANRSQPLNGPPDQSQFRKERPHPHETFPNRTNDDLQDLDESSDDAELAYIRIVDGVVVQSDRSAVRSQPPHDTPDQFKFREELRQLQEAFPHWTNDDLKTLLIETSGDVQLASVKIIDGVAAQWGEVSRKKGKNRGVRGSPARRGTAIRGRGGRSRGGIDTHYTDFRHLASTSTTSFSAPPASYWDRLTDLDFLDLDPSEIALFWDYIASEQEMSAPPSPSPSPLHSPAQQPPKPSAPLPPAASPPDPVSAYAYPSGTTVPKTKLSWAQVAAWPKERPASSPPVRAPEHVQAQQVAAAGPAEPSAAATIVDKAAIHSAAAPSLRPASHSTAGMRLLSGHPPVAVEKVGMLFGSLNLDEELLKEDSSEHDQTPIAVPGPKDPPAPRAKTKRQPQQLRSGATSTTSNFLVSILQSQQHQQFGAPPPHNITPASHPTTPPSHPTTPPSHPATPPSHPTALPQVSQAHHNIPSPILQSIHSTLFATPFTEPQPIAHQQPPQSTNVHQQQLPAHLQPHLPQEREQLYGCQPLPSELERSNHTQQRQQQQPLPSSYFRGQNDATSAPCFNPRSPTTQTQDSPYSPFGQLHQDQQHQQQLLHNTTFNDYRYGDNQRNIHDPYVHQQGDVGGRSVLTHGKSTLLPASQGFGNVDLLPPSVQSLQQHPIAQASGSAQVAGSDPQVQQGYASPVSPVPYYIPLNGSQAQYFVAPQGSSHGGPQLYVMYPVSQGPPGHSLVPGRPPEGLQPVMYNQSLYQGYNQPGPQHVQQLLPFGHAQGLGAVGNLVYGSPGQVGSGMQGFMGLGSQSSGPISPPGGPNRSGGSPETTYKPYSRVVGVGGDDGPVVQPLQVHTQALAQGGQGAFYGGHRFDCGVGGDGGVGGNVGAPQQGGHPESRPQSHLGYKQTGNKANFYQYHQGGGGYWQ